MTAFTYQMLVSYADARKVDLNEACRTAGVHRATLSRMRQPHAPPPRASTCRKIMFAIDRLAAGARRERRA